MRKKIVFITPGPVFRPEAESYQSHYINLSHDFSGYIFTVSSRAQKMSIGSFYFASIGSNFSFMANFKFMFFCLWNALKLRGEKIDLVLTYDPIKTGLIGLLFSKIVGAKFAPEVNGVYTSPAEWLDLPDNFINRLKRFVIPRIIRFVLKRSDGIKLLFENQIDFFHDAVHGKIISVFPCFVPTSQFKNLGEKKEILFAGFPFKRKGVDILILAFKKLSSKYPDWKLKILGWFPDSEDLMSAINGHPQIYHHKPVHFPEMPEHIGSCAILVLPSRSEAMGRVLVEAMAAGKPRIGSNVDGIPTVIDDGIDGFLVEPENVEDLVDKLDTLMSSAELRKKMGEAGVLRIRREFTEKKYIDNISSFYREILNA